MTSNNPLTQPSSGKNEQRSRRSDRRSNIERRKQSDPGYSGPFRRMEPDRRMKTQDRRKENRDTAKESRFELKIL